MNAFQELCRAHLADALAPRGIELVFEPLPGDPDPFGATPDRSGHLRAEIRAGGRLFEIYLYEKEAAFRTERNWYVFEEHRHERPEALIGALARELETWLDR